MNDMKVPSSHGMLSKHMKEEGTRYEPKKERKAKTTKTTKTTKIATMVKLSPALAAICGVDRCDRSKVSRYLWDYIKSNELQNPSDGRQILCDSKLEKVMECKTISMFQMNVC